MAESSTRAAAVVAIRKALKEGKVKDARLLASIFRATSKSSHEDQIFYGRMMATVGDWGRAEKVLAYALRSKYHEEAAIDLEMARWMLKTRPPLRTKRAGVALSYLLDQENIGTVLDVGSGGGEHALLFSEAGKSVHCVDFGRSVYVQKSEVLEDLSSAPQVTFSQMDFMELESSRTYDLVWCSHVLEHQPNANAFLKKTLSLVTPGGWLAITVPPLKHKIVGGHVSLWNAGLILYQLVMAGNDCSDAVVMNYGYNISVLVRRRDVVLPELDYDSGDVDRLAAFLPSGCSERFDGRMIGHAFRDPPG
ncbi:class I SAM-dependent methyltransferase [Xanthobacteraceae bacterium A53D]